MFTRSAPLFFCAQGWSHMSLCQAEGGIGYRTRIHPLPNSCKVSSTDIKTTSRADESWTAPLNTSCLQHANGWGHQMDSSETQLSKPYLPLGVVFKVYKHSYNCVAKHGGRVRLYQNKAARLVVNASHNIPRRV